MTDSTCKIDLPDSECVGWLMWIIDEYVTDPGTHAISGAALLQLLSSWENGAPVPGMTHEFMGDDA